MFSIICRKEKLGGRMIGVHSLPGRDFVTNLQIFVVTRGKIS